MKVPGSQARAFAFFSDVRRLNTLTPRWFRLDVLAVPDALRLGASIRYRLRWRGLRFRWTSVITHWTAPSYFDYQQTEGPFRFFRHEHVFTPCPEGTLVVDRVSFAVAGGACVAKSIVMPDLRRVFARREEVAQMQLGWAP